MTYGIRPNSSYHSSYNGFPPGDSSDEEPDNMEIVAPAPALTAAAIELAARTLAASNLSTADFAAARAITANAPGLINGGQIVERHVNDGHNT